MDSSAADNQPTLKVFVGGLSYNTTTDSLRAKCEEVGEVTDAIVIIDRETSRSRGFGFVTYSTAASAEQAVKCLNGCDLEGRQIRVDAANQRTGGRGGGQSGPPRSNYGGERSGGYNSSRGGGGYGGGESRYGGGGGGRSYGGANSSYGGGSGSGYGDNYEGGSRSYGGGHGGGEGGEGGRSHGGGERRGRDRAN